MSLIGPDIDFFEVIETIWDIANDDDFDEEELYKRLKKDGEYYTKKNEIKARLRKYPFLRTSRRANEELLNSASYHVSIGDATQFEKEVIPILKKHLEIYKEASSSIFQFKFLNWWPRKDRG